MDDILFMIYADGHEAGTASTVSTGKGGRLAYLTPWTETVACIRVSCLRYVDWIVISTNTIFPSLGIVVYATETTSSPFY